MSPLGFDVIAASKRRSVPASGGGGLAFLGAAASTTATQTARDLGEPAPNRTIIAAIGRRVASGGNIASVTIGGVAATIDIESATWDTAAIARAVVPNGLTGDVVVTVSGEVVYERYVALYAAYGTVTVVGTAQHYNANPSASISHPAGAHLVAAAYSSSSDSTAEFWTWQAPMIESGDAGDIRSHGSSAHYFDTPAGPTTVAATALANTYNALAVAAYTIGA